MMSYQSGGLSVRLRSRENETWNDQEHEGTDRHVKHVRYASKRMQQFVKFVRRFLIRNCAALLWFVQKALRYGIAALFAKRAAIW